MGLDINCYSNFVGTYSGVDTCGYDGTTNGFAPIFQQAMRNNYLRFTVGSALDSDTLTVTPLMFLYPA
jgi:hypothetical protein